MTISSDFLQALAQKLGVPASGMTAFNDFFNQWQPFENTQAQFNPLATTQGAQGATSFNSSGVKNFPDMATGVDATAQPLQNGDYPALMNAIQTGDFSNKAALA